MNVETVERRFSSYLNESWMLSNVVPFLLAYIRLLLLYKSELSPAILNTVLERQKQLLGAEYKDEGFDELRKSSRKQMERDVRKNTSATRGALLNRLLFSAFLDTEESDFFYLTEPMFEFVREMKVSSDQLKNILESEFSGFH